MTCYAGAMKMMGIDYGTKRVGIALSDDAGRMAFPHAVLPNDAAFLSSLTRILKDEHVEKIVVGHSLDRKGKPNAVHDQVLELIQDLTLRSGLPVELESEQYTTQEALRVQGRNDMTDASAAALILNSHITRTDTI